MDNEYFEKYGYPPFYADIREYWNNWRGVMSNNFFTKMCQEAIEELASGKKGWRDTDTNTLFLACFGMLYNHLVSRLSKPLWFFAGSVFAGIVTYVIISILGG